MIDLYFFPSMNPKSCVNLVVFHTLISDYDSKSLSFDQIPSIVNANATVKKK